VEARPWAQNGQNGFYWTRIFDWSESWPDVKVEATCRCGRVRGVDWCNVCIKSINIFTHFSFILPLNCVLRLLTIETRTKRRAQTCNGVTRILDGLPRCIPFTHVIRENVPKRRIRRLYDNRIGWRDFKAMLSVFVAASVYVHCIMSMQPRLSICATSSQLLQQDFKHVQCRTRQQETK
jgi:hypothetical protein